MFTVSWKYDINFAFPSQNAWTELC